MAQVCDLIREMKVRVAARGSGAGSVVNYLLGISGVDPMRQAGAFGWVECDALGGRLPVEHGVFNLFVDTEPGVKHMLYRLFFRDGVGHPLTMTGFKVVKNDAGFDVWKDTTTLFTRVLRGHVAEGDDDTADLVASGIIRIRARDFAVSQAPAHRGSDRHRDRGRPAVHRQSRPWLNRDARLC